MKKKKTEPEVLYKNKSEEMIPREKRTAVVEAELDKLVSTHGTVSPVLMVDVARAEHHPLHKFFCWDDTEAAHKYRIVQATNMILATRFVCVLKQQEDAPPTVVTAIPERKVSLRKFLPAYDGESGYSDRPTVLSDAEARGNLVQRRLVMLRSWCDAVVDIEELDPIRKEIERLVAQ